MVGLVCRVIDHSAEEELGAVSCQGVSYEEIHQYNYYYGPFWAYIAAYVGLAILAGELSDS